MTFYPQSQILLHKNFMQLVYQPYFPFDNLPIFDALSQESEEKKERGLG